MKLGRNTSAYAGLAANLFGASRLGGLLQGVQQIKDKERDHKKWSGIKKKKRRDRLSSDAYPT